MELLIDPSDASLDGVHDLIARDGEHARAIAGLSRTGRRTAVPLRLYLEIYAYEVLERMRERMTTPDWQHETWRIPFWPECLFEAAGHAVHPARELQAMYVEPAAVCVVTPGAAAVRAASRDLLGSALNDVDRYRELLLATAGDHGWQIEPTT